jgi:dUTP pyrophosphatase
MKVRYIKMHPDAVLPTKGTPQAAAYDLVAIEDAYIPIGETVMVGTGLSMQIPEGWKGEIYSRSGLASQGIVVANSPGKIDSDYRGEIKVLLRNDRVTDLVGIKKGDRIAQFEINIVHSIEFEEAQDLDFTARGEDGFGSTGY